MYMPNKKATSRNEDGAEESIELPYTDLIGIDGERCEHRFSQAHWTVYVMDGDEFVYEQDVSGGQTGK